MNRHVALRLSLLLVACLLPAVVWAAGAQDDLPPTASASPAPTRFESEPNDDFASADGLHQLGDVMSATIRDPYDVDTFKISTRYGRHLLFDVDIPAGSSLLWPVLCLYDQDQVLIACNTDGDLYYEPLLFYSTYGGTYYVQVEDWNGAGGDYRLMVYNPLFVSARTDGVVAGIPFTAADIMAHYDFADGTEKWLTFIEAGDLGLTQNITGLVLHLETWVHLVFDENQLVDVGGQSVILTPYQIASFHLRHPGTTTAGSFDYVEDVRLEGLTTAAERLDALTISGAVLGLSTTGTAAAPWLPKTQDEDLFYTYAPGFFDGSRVRGLAAEDVIAAELAWGQAEMYLTILGNGVIDGQHFNQKDIFRVNYSTGEVLGLYWNGPAHGFDYDIDAFELGWDDR